MIASSSADPCPVSPIHTAVKGRTRFRVHGLRRCEALKLAIEIRLSGNGIRRASANTLTGNVLVLHDPDRAVDEVASAIVAVLQLHNRGLTPVPHRNGHGNGCHWHRIDAREVAARFTASITSGLTQEQAIERLREHGPNTLTSYQPRSRLSIFLEQLRSLPVILLMGSAAISLLTGGLGDCVVIGIVVLLNAGIGCSMEWRAEGTIAALLNLTEPPATVIREGVARTIPGEQIVEGDLIVLKRGEQAPADARIIECQNLTVDESALTGESMAVQKRAEALSTAPNALADRSNMVYRGTIITGGAGLAIVVATGPRTEMGAIQHMIACAVRPETPLERQLRVLSSQMLRFAGLICGGVLLTGLLRGFSAGQMLRSAVSLAIAAVPEGLPAVATTALASGLRNLLHQKVLLRRLDALETLGALQTVCLDKTGTLTMNRMSAVRIFAGLRSYIVEAGGVLSNGRSVGPRARAEIARLLEVGALCSEAEPDGRNGAAWTGSSTETALVELAIKSGFDVAQLRRRHRLLRMEQRTEQRNYMRTLHAGPGGRQLVAVKGNPIEVLALCDRYQKNGMVQRLARRQRAAIEDENERMAGAALRVLGLAYLELEPGEAPPERGLIWLGLVGMADPTREGLREVIAELRRAGIRPVMLTGDQKSTAEAVGHALELRGGDGLTTMSGAELDELSDDQLAQAILDVDIFSRVSPTQKVKLVQAFQRAGRVVAMTGDGINDSPALRMADIGITLGRSGARLARETADVVLRDDNIGTLIPAIREGRRIHENIRRAIHYITATNASEVLLMFSALGLGLGQPLNPRQLLWINLLTDVFPELAFALQPADKDLLREPPAEADGKVIDREDAVCLGRQAAVITVPALAAYGFAVARYGAGARASAVAFLTLTSGQLLHALSARSDRPILGMKPQPENRYLTASVGAGFGMLALACWFPGVRGLLGLAPIGCVDLVLCAGAAASSLMWNEIRKSGRSEAAIHPRRRPLLRR
ncbi:MAG: cation-translocating P-type ATPase [Bryobacteraceae bacterium]